VNVSDETLILGVLNGDRQAFAELYDRRARLIRAVCHDHTRDFHAAADLTQEVFLRAYQKLGALRDPQRFTPWLVGIARQVCREWRRQRLRDSRKVARYASHLAIQRPVCEPPDQRLVDLREAIAAPSDTAGGRPALSEKDGSAGGRPALSEKERLALHAFYLQGRDVDEARNVLGLSRSGFYRVLASAVGRLRRLFDTPEVRR
jgi:RNA polymerase sigma-70 factor, ECF subfamily